MSVMAMVIAFLLTRSKIKLFFVWFVSCFIPFFIFVYSEEQGVIEVAKDMDLLYMLEIYAGIFIISVIMGFNYAFNLVCFICFIEMD